MFLIVPVYQLGVDKVCLTGEILMSAGLPGYTFSVLSLILLLLLTHTSIDYSLILVKFYTLDDSIMFLLTKVDSIEQKPVSVAVTTNTTRPSSLSITTTTTKDILPDKAAPSIPLKPLS